MMDGWPFPWQKVRNPFVIPPGALRNQVVLQQKSTTPTATGSPQSAWTTVLTCMAAIVTVSGQERFQQSFSGQVSHRVSIFWPGASIPVAQGMQVLFGSRTFTIQYVDNVQERNRVLHIYALEIDGVQ